MKYTVISTEYGLMTDFTMTYDEAISLINSMDPEDAGDCWIVCDESCLLQYVHSANEAGITYRLCFVFQFIHLVRLKGFL